VSEGRQLTVDVSCGLIQCRSVERAVRDAVLRSGAARGDRCQCRAGVDMAGTRAVAQLADRVFRGRVVVLRVRIAPVVTGMASRAGIGISRCAPRNRVGTGRMAGLAGQQDRVIARVIDRRMTERDRRPGGGRMADVALACRGPVRRTLACGGGAVVAIGAAPGNAGVTEARWFPRQGRMATVALGGSRNVRGWFARGAHTVMAAAAGAGHDAHVIEARRCPGGRRVAGVAGIGAGNMVDPLAPGDRAVMAGEAGT